MASSTSSISDHARTGKAKVPFWLLPNLLSLDAPVIASLWQNLFAQDAGVKLSLAGRAALPLAVWLIYLTDRLLDTARGKCVQETARHTFCRDNRILCCALAGVAALLSGISVFFLPVPIFKSGVAILGMVGAYLLMVHGIGGNMRRWLPKEAAVGLIFSLGTVLAPIAWALHPARLIFPALVLGTLCWINSSAIEVWEGGSVDAWSGWTVGHLSILALFIALVCLATSVLLPGEHSWWALLLVSLGYFAVNYLRPEFSSDLLRVSIDLPLLTPLLFLGLR